MVRTWKQDVFRSGSHGGYLVDYVCVLGVGRRWGGGMPRCQVGRRPTIIVCIDDLQQDYTHYSILSYSDTSLMIGHHCNDFNIQILCFVLLNDLVSITTFGVMQNHTRFYACKIIR